MSKLNICLDDTVETFIYQKEALEIKLKHNIAELSNKNTYLSTILKELCTKEKQEKESYYQSLMEIIKTCKDMEDDLAGLDILEKKTQILKAAVLGIAYQMKELEQKETLSPIKHEKSPQKDHKMGEQSQNE